MSKNDEPLHVAVIGAGPAGLMAAEVLAAGGARVTIYDRMPSPARKFLMAGRGGLNLTNSEPFEQLLTRYGRTLSPALKHALTEFPPSALRRWAHGLGEETFVGSSGRIFPKAMKASPLLRAWLRRLDTLGVRLATRHEWTGFDAGMRTLMIRNGDGEIERVTPDAVVFALGGASWPRLGADGSWRQAFDVAGVPVTPLQPSNCGVTIAWSPVFATRFAGAPLKRIAVSLDDRTSRGEAVVTRTGLEGGAIYALSAEIRAALERTAPARLMLDLKPDVALDNLTERLRTSRKGDTLTNVLRKNAGLDAAAIGLLRERALPTKPEDLARHIKTLPVEITGISGLERAISTAGGIRFADLDGDLMLKAHPGIFLAGEMLDWDAPTGGYLLQACFATGVAAARGALRWMEQMRDPEAAPRRMPTPPDQTDTADDAPNGPL